MARGVAASGVRLFGVASSTRDPDGGVPAECGFVRTRDLAALVKPVSDARRDLDPSDIDLHQRIIEGAFDRGGVLPAPCGTVFRNTEQVRGWMEQNYLALSEGLQFVAGRCEARVHLLRRPPKEGEAPQSPPPAGITECFRALRRVSAAAMTLPPTVSPEPALFSAAFLLDREHWRDFETAVHGLGQRYTGLVMRQTGPWPPYDFVRLEFGS
ncbi:MAG TPA: GvpL/GvpF family gas vesicle protein [Gemmatimonadaceae bacterium]|nr:GvpL/GvpF family gas vesicle protein [Gemmatimonadaceae bacterium]